MSLRTRRSERFGHNEAFRLFSKISGMNLSSSVRGELHFRLPGQPEYFRIL